MKPVVLKPLNELMPQVERVLGCVFAQLRAMLPDAELHHIGATAIPSAITKGDVDALVRVSPARFSPAVETLRQHFAEKQTSNWTADFASFGDDTGYELPLGIQVVVKDSSADFLLFLRDYFVANHDALTAYNRLKLAHSDQGAEEYWKAKDAFLGEILTSRDNGRVA